MGVLAARDVENNNDVFDLDPTHRPESPKVRRIKNPASISDANGSVASSGAVLDVVEEPIGPNIPMQATKLNIEASSGPSDRVGRGRCLASHGCKRGATAEPEGSSCHKQVPTKGIDTS